MQLSVTGRHVDITGPMRQYAEEKALKLARFFDRIDSIDIIVDREPIQHRIEVVIHTDHKQSLVGQVAAGDFYEAIDLVVDKLSQQLRKHKEKLRHRKRSIKPGTKMTEEEVTEQES